MISNISKLAIQLTPLLAVLSTFMILFTYLAPVPILLGSIPLISIGPATPQTSTEAVNIRSFVLESRRLPRAAALKVVARADAAKESGATLLFGLLGSCTTQDGAAAKCTAATLNGTYDISSLPSTVPFVSAPPQTSPHWMLISIIFLVLFLFLTTFPLIPNLPPSISNFLGKPFWRRAVAWIGFLGWMVGMTTAIVLRVSFGNDVDRFNTMAASTGVALNAAIGNGFNLLWIAYALATPALFCSLFRLHMEGKTI